MNILTAYLTIGTSAAFSSAPVYAGSHAYGGTDREVIVFWMDSGCAGSKYDRGTDCNMAAAEILPARKRLSRRDNSIHTAVHECRVGPRST